MSPTQRSKQHLQKLGYQVAIVERWNHYAQIRQDLFGCIDLLAIRNGCPVLAVQCTSPGNLAARVAKCTNFGQAWLATGCTQLECWAWRKVQGQKTLVLDRRPIPHLYP